MKLGSVDGSVEEFRDLLENHGSNLEDYLGKPPAPLKTRFLIAPAVILGIALIFLVLFQNNFSETVLTLINLIGFGSGTWLTVSAQIRFKNTLATFAVAIGAILMILVASGIFSPKEAAEFVQEIQK